jgi:hypothetical protein
MKTSLKMLAIAAALTFSATSCSQKEQDKAEATTEAAGDSMANAADNVQADMAREPGDTAVVLERPANGVVEETPATQK